MIMKKQMRLSAKPAVYLFLFFFLSGLAGLSSLWPQTSFYWEQPEPFLENRGTFPVSAFTGDLGIVAWQESDNSPVDGVGSGSTSIALAVKKSGGEWENRGIIGGPYSFSGPEPSILSAAIDKSGRIIIAAAAAASQTEILISSDEGRSFSRSRIDSGTENSVAPRISVLADGSYLLFIVRGNETELSIFYSRSGDAVNWPPFQPLVTEPGMQLNFLPSHTSFGGREYVVFQSFMGGGTENIPAFQLFLKTSEDGGRTWGPVQRLTSFRDAYINTDASADAFDNQRPHLSVGEGSLFLVWERRYRTGLPQIYCARFRQDGSLVGAAERVNSVSAYCNNPVAFSYNGETKIMWFDNRRGRNRIYLAQRSGPDWQNIDLPGITNRDASFGRPVVDGDGLYILWQAGTGQGASSIYSLFPDTSVEAVRIRAENFTAGSRGRNELSRVSWNVPSDSSGIEGFSYMWSQDEEAAPPETVMIYNSEDRAAAGSLELSAEEDGAWYFSVAARDFAGNWSLPSKIEYVRDTIPPPVAALIQPELDDNGFLLSNTFRINWNPPPASDIAGYTWNLRYLGVSSPYEGMSNDEMQTAAESLYPVSRITAPRLQGSETQAVYTNSDNGLWLFTVQAIDEVGNVGLPAGLFFRTDKYVPHTYISWADARQDEQGVLSLNIHGRGFNEGGNVSRVFLDSDGGAPYDREFLLSRGDYRIVSDREIAVSDTENLESGSYRIVLEHPARGVYVSAPLVSIENIGTVKFGDFTASWKTIWQRKAQRSFDFDTPWMVLIFVTCFCAFGILVTVRGIGNVIAEGAVLRQNAAALLTGDFMPSEKKKRYARIKRQGLGLRFKLASFTVVLVMFVVVMVSVPLYMMMTQTRRETMFQSLLDRSTVLLEGLASNARAYLPQRNMLELGFLPAQMGSIPEAEYVTITGYNPDATIYDDQVYATNDPDIQEKIDTLEFQAGISRISDVLTPRLTQISEALNERAREEIGVISENIASLTQEGISLATRTDAASVRRLEDIQVQTRALETRVTERLAEIGREIGSEPEFSLENFEFSPNHRYIFFKPIMYRRGSEDIFFRGLIRLEVSIDTILESIRQSQRELLQIIVVVALIAIAIGTVGALILSTLIIRPIKKLVSHVEIIRDTENKEDLAGVDITIKSQDEIAVLGNTINDMTHGLVKAAAAASDLSIGKEIQKKFIPLDLDREGNKLSSGFKDTKNLHFFGYYEGAKGVSGDYFDYQDLDGRYYAIIKCDVAGKGIPAALIMIQVATMFLNYFKGWKPTEKGLHIEDLVYQINDFIETLAFKGRFAAFTLCLFDSQSGVARFCNAGDNVVHLFDSSEGKIKTITFPETPATGVLPNFLIEAKGGYVVNSVTIDHGDILLLYTDGIEEAKRKFRNANFQEILCDAGEKDTPHETHTVGQADEEMGPERVADVINSVMNREVYTLKKWHNPEGDEKELRFDFTECESSVEDVIMAMVSVEKIFRCYKTPNTNEDDRVVVDKKVDAFLKKHFDQYRSYCSYTREIPGFESYMNYTHLKEDEQYDDLTILGIRRK